jgi:hypothetical protein
MHGVNQYSSVSEALRDLNTRGFTDSFTVEPTGLRSMATGMFVNPEEITIVEYHRFEGETNPDDMSAVYALEYGEGKRGIIVDAYGAYADPILAEHLKKMKLSEGKGE